MRRLIWLVTALTSGWLATMAPAPVVAQENPGDPAFSPFWQPPSDITQSVAPPEGVVPLLPPAPVPAPIAPPEVLPPPAADPLFTEDTSPPIDLSLPAVQNIPPPAPEGLPEPPAPEPLPVPPIPPVTDPPPPPPGNQPPSLVGPATVTVNEGATLSFSVSVSDPDAGQTVSVQTSVLPAGAAFDGTTFTWTPTYAQAGTYTVGLIALDNGTPPATSAPLSVVSAVSEVVDTASPTITLNGANPLLLELGTPYVEPGATASDLVDGDLSGQIQFPLGVDSNIEGSATLTYTVADAAGNTASATRTVTVVVTPNSYGLIATHSLHLRNSARITSGFAGVVERGQAPFLAGKAELVVGTNVQTGPQVRLSAPRVRVRKEANIAGELVYSELVAVDRRATIADREQVGPEYFPLFQGFGLPAFQTGTPGSQDVEVRQKGSATINAGAYDEVRVKQKGTLTFTGGTYQLGDLEVGQQAKVIFLAPTTLLIRGQLSLDQRSSFGPGSGIDPSDILVYVEGRNGRLGNGHDDDEGDDEEDDAEGRRLRKTPRAAKIGVQASFQGNLYAPNGTLHLRQGSTAVGSFIARDLIVGVRVQVAAQSGWNTPGVIHEPQSPMAKLAGTQGEAAALPGSTGLLANYPNPFNPSTTVPYVLGEVAQVKLSVYNVLGQQIRVLVDQLQVPGTYTASWDGMDASGVQAAGGVYFYRLQAGEHVQVRKMLFAK